jgi:hypothetical protein
MANHNVVMGHTLIYTKQENCSSTARGVDKKKHKLNQSIQYLILFKLKIFPRISRLDGIIPSSGKILFDGKARKRPIANT